MTIDDEHSGTVTQFFDYPPPQTNDDDSDTEEEETDSDVVLQVQDHEWEPKTLFPPMKKKAKHQVNNEEKDNVDVTDPIFAVHDIDDAVKSKVGNAILKVLGPSASLTKFEHNYNILKSFPNEKRLVSMVEVYKRSLVHHLKELRQKALKLIGDWEKTFFLDHLREPSSKDYDTPRSILDEKIRLVEKILVSWKESC